MKRIVDFLKDRKYQRAAATVEFAVILPVLLMILFGILEFGRVLFVNQALSWAAREGARVAALPGTDNTLVTSVVNAKLAESGIPAGTVTTVPADITTAGTNTPIKVTITLSYDDVAYIITAFVPLAADKQLSGVATMRRS